MIRFIAGDTHRHLSTSGKRHSTTTWDRGLSMRYRGRRSSGARAIGAVVARFVHTEEVTGSNPVSPTPVSAPICSTGRPASESTETNECHNFAGSTPACAHQRCCGNFLRLSTPTSRAGLSGPGG
jgi:hypothetical protein